VTVTIIRESGDHANVEVSRQPGASSRGGALPSAGTTIRSGRNAPVFAVTMYATSLPSGESLGFDPLASRRAADPSSLAAQTLGLPVPVS
jgi:hypothetical protein